MTHRRTAIGMAINDTALLCLGIIRILQRELITISLHVHVN